MKINYLISPLLVLITAVTGSLITSQNMDWYRTLQLPSFTPEGKTIALVWMGLFILQAIALLITQRRSSAWRFAFCFAIFLGTCVLNVYWSYLFFGQHNLSSAIWEAGILTASILFLAIVIWPVSRLASLLLWPYIAWTGFATFLTYSVWYLNH